MKGKILEIQKENRRGTISAENRNYFFNSDNVDPRIHFDELKEGDNVEFEVKQYKGKEYANKIHFPISISHSNGDFKLFVYINASKLYTNIEKLIDPDCFKTCHTYDDKLGFLYKHIAEKYNHLNDDDFIFENQTCVFKSGFVATSGEEILLRCVPHQTASSKWYCEDLICNGQTYSGCKSTFRVFDIVKANWYDIKDDLQKLLSDNFEESALNIIKKIENRCQDETSLVWLCNGENCTEVEADELYVPTDYYKSDDNSGKEKELYLYCSKRTGIKGFSWYYNSITYENAPLTVYEKKMWLEKWSALPVDRINMLSNLANKTLKETWSFSGKNDYGILKNYLTYTFAYLYANNAISYSDGDKKYAAFNTGLPDRTTYKYLYAFFEKKAYEEKNDLYYSHEYVFKEFVIAGRGGNGKVLSESIRPLPSPPLYFEARGATVWDLDFNDGNQISMPEYDDTHILIQRCDRIPLNFYKRCGFLSNEFSSILNSNNKSSEKYRAIRDFFSPIINNEPNDEVSIVYGELETQLNNVINVALKKLSWNWRAVVPCYNPEEDKPCYLLPVSFANNNQPDRAMIASVDNVNNEKVYHIHTVIPLDWAYLDARLVCRPESEWLVADCLSNNDEDNLRD